MIRNALIVLDGYSYWLHSYATKTHHCTRKHVCLMRFRLPLKKSGEVHRSVSGSTMDAGTRILCIVQKPTGSRKELFHDVKEGPPTATRWPIGKTAFEAILGVTFDALLIIRSQSQLRAHLFERQGRHIHGICVTCRERMVKRSAHPRVKTAVYGAEQQRFRGTGFNCVSWSTSWRPSSR